MMYVFSKKKADADKPVGRTFWLDCVCRLSARAQLLRHGWPAFSPVRFRVSEMNDMSEVSMSIGAV